MIPLVIRYGSGHLLQVPNDIWDFDLDPRLSRGSLAGANPFREFKPQHGAAEPVSLCEHGGDRQRVVAACVRAEQACRMASRFNRSIVTRYHELGWSIDLVSLVVSIGRFIQF